MGGGGQGSIVFSSRSLGLLTDYILNVRPGPCWSNLCEVTGDATQDVDCVGYLRGLLALVVRIIGKVYTLSVRVESNVRPQVGDSTWLNGAQNPAIIDCQYATSTSPEEVGTSPDPMDIIHLAPEIANTRNLAQLSMESTAL
jgi:hypothetical protein